MHASRSSAAKRRCGTSNDRRRRPQRPQHARSRDCNQPCRPSVVGPLRRHAGPRGHRDRRCRAIRTTRSTTRGNRARRRCPARTPARVPAGAHAFNDRGVDDLSRQRRRPGDLQGVNRVTVQPPAAIDEREEGKDLRAVPGAGRDTSSWSSVRTTSGDGSTGTRITSTTDATSRERASRPTAQSNNTTSYHGRRAVEPCWIAPTARRSGSPGALGLRTTSMRSKSVINTSAVASHAGMEALSTSARNRYVLAPCGSRSTRSVPAPRSATR